MSSARATASAAQRMGSGAGRVVRAWRTLPHERRLAAGAAIGLFATLFLPWYHRQFFVLVAGHPQQATDSQTAWAAFSFVEAAVLLVAAGVLMLLFQRAEGRAFHLPGGDGWVIMAAGVWAGGLIVWRMFDKQSAATHGAFVTSYGIEWGIFIALAVAAFLAYTGSRIRAAHRPEPPLPGEDTPRPAPPPRSSRRTRPPRPVRAFDEMPDWEGGETSTHVVDLRGARERFSTPVDAEAPAADTRSAIRADAPAPVPAGPADAPTKIQPGPADAPTKIPPDSDAPTDTHADPADAPTKIHAHAADAPTRVVAAQPTAPPPEHAAGASDEPRPRVARDRSRFPRPEPPEDPPTMRFGRPLTSEGRRRTQREEGQQTLPLDDDPDA